MMRTIMTGLLLVALPTLNTMADELDETVDVQPGGTLYVDLDRGSIQVESHDADQVRVEARATGWASWGVDFDLWQDGNDVHLVGDSSPWAFFPFGGARVHVRAWVPRHYSLSARTSGGRIELAHLSGRISGETTGGQVIVRGASGPVDVHTSGGRIEVSDVEGDLNAETSGGAVSVRNLVGGVWARTTGGRIQIERVAGEVDAATSGGSVLVTFSNAPGGSVETSGGAIEVRFPAGEGADLDAKTSGGRVRVAQDLSPREGFAKAQHVVGAINGGGAPLRLRTSGGNIDVGVL